MSLPITEMNAPAKPDRLGALRRFAAAITLLNILGHLFFGFEESLAQVFAALAAAYGMELLLETVSAWQEKRRATFTGGVSAFLHFLLPAHISAMAVSMLLYGSDRIAPFAFAAAVAIGSKALFRAPVGKGMRHVLNPSNTGIATTLLLFPAIGISPPYHFTENLSGIGDWLLPAIIILSGTFLNARFTYRIPLIVGWLGGFVIQAVVRSAIFGVEPIPALLPMSGMAFVLFTFYMVTDPATTPDKPVAQFLFGASVAGMYALLVSMHIVFGLFFALFAVCILRGVGLWAAYFIARWAAERNMGNENAPSALPVGAEPASVRLTVTTHGGQ